MRVDVVFVRVFVRVRVRVLVAVVDVFLREVVFLLLVVLRLLVVSLLLVVCRLLLVLAFAVSSLLLLVLFAVVFLIDCLKKVNPCVLLADVVATTSLVVWPAFVVTGTGFAEVCLTKGPEEVGLTNAVVITGPAVACVVITGLDVVRLPTAVTVFVTVIVGLARQHQVASFVLPVPEERGVIPGGQTGQRCRRKRDLSGLPPPSSDSNASCSMSKSPN